MREPPLPRVVRDVEWRRPDGTLWARDRSSDAAAAKVRLSHVDQGFLGDCYLVAAMGAMALQQPTRIERMVTMRPDSVEVNLPAGTVRVTRDLPLRDGRPLFAASGTNKVLWPAYIEKAVAATRRGGYGHLDHGGEVATAFRWLTGKAPRELPAPPSDNIVDDVAALLRDGRPVVVDAPLGRAGSSRRMLMDRLGLHGDHCYVVQAADVRRGAGTLRLWNPWGTDQPKVLTAEQARVILDRVTSDTVTWRMPRPARIPVPGAAQPGRGEPDAA